MTDRLITILWLSGLFAFPLGAAYGGLYCGLEAFVGFAALMLAIVVGGAKND